MPAPLRSTDGLRAHVLVLAKEPVPGKVKTRLSPPLNDTQCAEVATACLAATLTAVTATPGVARTLILSGRPGPWLPAGFSVLPQRGGSLGERLAAAFDDAWALTQLPMLLVGMDTPQLTSSMLARSLDTLLAPGADAVLGRAQDGGWWALGLHDPLPGAFDGVPMSTALAGQAQHDRLTALGRPVTPLPVLRDVDDVVDLAAVAELLPPTDPLRRLVDELVLDGLVLDGPAPGVLAS